jgi:hypothetical protein
MVGSILQRLRQPSDEGVQDLLDESSDALAAVACDLVDLILEAGTAANVPLLCSAGCPKVTAVRA